MSYLIGLAVAVALAGCGATTTTTITQSATVSVTTTTTRIRTIVKRGPPPPAQTTTTTTTITAQPTASSSASGNGTENLGTINVSTPSTIQWTCSGCSTFAMGSGLDSSGNAISLDSTAGSGASAIDAGSYGDVQVISDGSWSIRIVPG